MSTIVLVIIGKIILSREASEVRYNQTDNSMSKDIPRKRDVSIIRSSAAEYLTFIAATGDQSDAIEVRYQDENIWLTQRLMASLYGVTVQAIGQHLKRILADGELEESSVIKKYFITATDGPSVFTCIASHLRRWSGLAASQLQATRRPFLPSPHPWLAKIKEG